MDSAITTSPPRPLPPPPSALRRWGTLAVCCVAGLLLAVDNTVLNLALPRLSSAMRPSSTQLLWIGDAYGFAVGALLIVMGRLGERVGRKRMLLCGAAVFGLVSALTAYAPSPGLLIAARALQGAAAATVMPSTLSLLRHTFTDPRERTTAMGVAGGIGAGGFALGPVVAGPLLDHFWWGSVFLVNVPVVLVVLVSGSLLLVEHRSPAPAPLDWASVPLSGGGLVGVVYAIKALARSGPGDPWAWAAAAVGAALLVLFVRRQRRVAHPLLDLSLLRVPALTGSVTAVLFTIVALSAQSLAFSLYFQDVRGYSPMGTGFALLVGPLGAVFSGPLAATVIGRIGRSGTVVLGLLCSAVSCFGYAAVGVGTDYWLLAAPVFVSGVGIGFVMGVTNDTVLAAVDREQAGVAAALGETATELGGALGVAVLGSVLTAGYRHGLHLPPGLPQGAGGAARQSVAGAVAVADGLPARLAGPLTHTARLAYVGGLHTAVLAGGVLLLLGAPVAGRLLRGVPALIPDPDAEADAETGAGAVVPTPAESRS